LHEEISFNQKCFKRKEEWIPKLNRFQCISPVGIVVGGWGIDTETGISSNLRLDFPDDFFRDANFDLLNPKVIFVHIQDAFFYFYRTFGLT
jgi:hypothetical protein